MKIALVSEKFINNDVEFNLKVILRTIQQASQDKIDLLVFGEAFLQGFDSLTWEYNQDCHVASYIFSYGIKFVRWMCHLYKVACAFGYFEIDQDSLYSSYIFIGKKGEIVNNYRRRSQGWKEYSRTDHHYGEGNCFDVFEYEGVTFSVALCGDLWQDDLCAEMEKIQADILLWPLYVNFTEETWLDEKVAYCERVARMKKTVLLVNSLSDEIPSVGGSFVMKDGKIISEGKRGEAAMLIYESVE